MKTVFAHTDVSNDYPAYINISRNKEGQYEVNSRSAGNGGRDMARVVLAPEVVELMASDLVVALHGGIQPPVDNAFVAEGCEMFSEQASTLAPHQQRVVIEKAGLDENIVKLDAFVLSEQFADLVGFDEMCRMINQLHIMKQLSAVLGQRIAAF